MINIKKVGFNPTNTISALPLPKPARRARTPIAYADRHFIMCLNHVQVIYRPQWATISKPRRAGVRTIGNAI